MNRQETRPYTWATFAGAWGYMTAAVAFYCGFAEITNEVYHRKVLPLGATRDDSEHWGVASCPGKYIPLMARMSRPASASSVLP